VKKSPKIAQPNLKINAPAFTAEKEAQFWLTFVIFKKKLLKENNHPTGEN
jgi:hypothetical protein